MTGESSIAAKANPTRWTWGLIVTLALIAVYALFFSALSIRHHQALQTHALDLGNMDQALWNTLHGRLLRNTNWEGGRTRLGAHFEPILIPLSLLYLLWSGLESILAFQSLVLALGALPIFLLARKRLESELAGVTFALVYLLFPALEAANMFDFHAVALAACFLAYAFYFVVHDRYLPFALCAVLTMSCKEEMPLIVFLMGLYIAIFRRRRWVGVATMAVSVGWFLLANLVIIPHYSPIGKNIHYERYGYLGEDLSDMLRTMITRPGMVWQSVTQEAKVAYLIRLLFPVGFLSLLAPPILALTLPTLAVNLLSEYAPMYALDLFHYSTPVVPLIIIAAIYGAGLLIRLARRWLQVKRSFLVLMLVAYVLILSLFYHAALGYTPLAAGFEWPAVGDHERLATRFFQQVPPNAVLSAQTTLNPHLSQRETIYSFPLMEEDTEYVLLDVTASIYPLTDQAEYYEQVRALLEGDFGVVAAEDGYLLLKRDEPRRSLPPSFYTFVYANVADVPDGPVIDFGGVLRLRGVTIVAERGNVMRLRAWWELISGEEIPAGCNLRVSLVDEAGQTFPGSEQYLAATLWYPPATWSPGEIIVTEARMQLPPALAGGKAGYGFQAVGTGDGGECHLRPQVQSTATFETGVTGEWAWIRP